MRILPLPSIDHRPACQLSCQALPIRLTVAGLAAADLQALFHASAGGRQPWPPQSSPAAIVIDNPDALPLPPAQAGRQCLQLGPDRVELASGQPARLHPGSDQGTATHFPQSLYLCLAQQWARSGVFALHAAGIVADGQGILALGERMAGKSTLALSALAAGHQVVSDDWLLLGIGSDGRCRIERLRGYLAIRPGPVRARLLPLAGLAAPRTAGNGDHRQLFDITHPAPARFPLAAAVNRLWLLAAGGDHRPGTTLCRLQAPAAALAGLVTAAMPLLLSAAFPVERQALMATAQSLLQQVVATHLTAGLDLVQTPTASWQRLIKTLAF